MAITVPRYRILPLRGTYDALVAEFDEINDNEICYAIDRDQYYQREGNQLVQVGATKDQGAKADSAVQPVDLGPVAFSNSYQDLDDKPSAVEVGDNISLLTNNIGYVSQLQGASLYATAAQGALANTAVQPEDLVWSQNGTTAYYNTGQVSIGTDNPPAADVLHLRGGAGSVTYPLLRFGYPATSVPIFSPVGQISFSDNAGATAAAMVVRNNEGNWTAGSAHPCDIEFYATPQFSASAVERFTITGDGEVYVGTSSTKKVKVLDDGKVVLNLSFLPVYTDAASAFIGGEESGTVCRDGNGNLFVAGAFG